MRKQLLSPIVLAVLVALLLCAGVVVVLEQRPSTKTLSADFPSTVSLYRGAEVKVLGVPIGKVTAIHVRGTSVHVRMSYDSDRKLPADTHAVIVPPSIVGDRFVQLTPAYTGGRVLADGATLAENRTDVPIELDQTYRSLNQLAATLGPKGANSNGALSRLLSATAQNLKGNGSKINRTVRDLSTAVSALSGSREDVAGTVSNLGRVTKTLATDDGQVRALVTNLAQVATQLNGQRGDIRTATQTLTSALDDVHSFVKQNRKGVKHNIAGLAKVSTTLAKHTKDLSEVLDIAPVGLSNLMNIYQPQNWDLSNPDAVDPKARVGSLALRAPLLNDLPIQLGHTMTAICGSLPKAQQQQLAPLCTALQRTGGNLGKIITKVINPAVGGGLVPAPPASSLAGLLGKGP